MEAKINFFGDLAAVSIALYGVVPKKKKYYPLYLLSGLVLYGANPLILNPILYKLLGMRSKSKEEKDHQQKHAAISKLASPGLVYHPRYNMTFMGLENYHPFDSTKYERVMQYLAQTDNKVIQNLISFSWKPERASISTLLKVMKINYLLSLNYSLNICKIIELPLFFLPNWLIRWRCLDPMLYATQGSIDASCIAIERGWSINIGGGYHHAHATGGSGFCVYPDITLSINHLREHHGDKVKRVMIIDLDAHQGNGHERDFIGDKDTFIIDFYNPTIFPGDQYAKKGIRDSGNIHVYPYNSGNEYLTKLKSVLEKCLGEFKPDFILYNAGTDCMIGDPLGQLKLTHDDIIKRDEIMFEFASVNKVPIMMILSGGYQKKNAECIANSIKNLAINKLISQKNEIYRENIEIYFPID